MSITVTHDINPKSIFHVQIILSKITLLWPIKTKSTTVRILVHIYCYFMSISLFGSSVVLLLKASKTTDLVDRSEAIDIFTLTLSAFYKMVFFILKHQNFRELMDFVEREFPIRPFCGDSSMTMEKWMRWAVPLSLLHYALGFCTVTFWGVTPLLNYLLGFINFSEMPLPINVWYPFEFNSGFKYFCLYVVHLFGLVTSGLIYMACDAFLFSLVYFANGQIELIKLSLKGIGNLDGNGTAASREKVQFAALKKCIQHHGKLLHFLRELDLIFRSMIVADVLHAIISLSFAMFQMSESKGVLAQMKMVIFVTYCFVHQYLNSAFGQFLINQQETLMSEVYGVNWMDRSLSFRKSVHIMMGGGCIKPVRLSAWRMYFLQYETFVEFVRTMVSFFMVLRTVQEDTTST